MGSRRTTGYVKQPAETVQSAIEDVMEGRVKLYVVQNIGPTSYVLRGEQPDVKFKVLLGSPHKCSCLCRAGPCTHILFVLLRVMRVPKEDPICWQASLQEREINQMLQYSKPGATALSRHRGSSKHAFLRRGQRGQTLNKNNLGDEQDAEPTVERKAISDDDVCPICQDALPDEEQIAKDGGNIAYCRFGCGNSIHIKCMKIWAEHRSSLKEQVTCPLCRVDWGSLALSELRKQETKVRNRRAMLKRQRNTHRGIKCGQCMIGSIVGSRYRCLYGCIDLCHNCYMTKNEHAAKLRHPFIIKKNVDEPWGSAPPSGNQSNIPNDLISTLQNRDISTEDYDLLLSLDDAYAWDIQTPTLQKLLVKNMRSVQASPDLASVDCKTCAAPLSAQTSLKQLPCCLNYVHESCAYDIALAEDGVCKICSNALFAGLRARNKRNSSGAKTRTPEVCDDSDNKERDDITNGLLSISGTSVASSASTETVTKPGIRTGIGRNIHGKNAPRAPFVPNFTASKVGQELMCCNTAKRKGQHLPRQRQPRVNRLATAGLSKISHRASKRFPQSDEKQAQQGTLPSLISVLKI